MKRIKKISSKRDILRELFGEKDESLGTKVIVLWRKMFRLESGVGEEVPGKKMKIRGQISPGLNSNIKIANVTIY